MNIFVELFKDIKTENIKSLIIEWYDGEVKSFIYSNSLNKWFYCQLRYWELQSNCKIYAVLAVENEWAERIKQIMGVGVKSVDYEGAVEELRDFVKHINVENGFCLIRSYSTVKEFEHYSLINNLELFAIEDIEDVVKLKEERTEIFESVLWSSVPW